MQLTELTAFATDDWCIRQAQQSHRGAGMAGISNFLHVLGEDHVLAVGRNLSSIDVPPVLTVDEPAVPTIGVGHPELGPAVTMILRLSRRAVREDETAAVREPVRRATIGTTDAVRLSRRDLDERHAPACPERVRHAREPSPVRRPGQLLEKPLSRELADNLPGGHVHDRNSLDRQAGDLLAIRAPARPRILPALTENGRGRAIASGEHKLSLGPVVIAIDRFTNRQAAEQKPAAVTRKLGRRLIRFRRAGEVAPIRPVGPAHEKIPVPALGSRREDEPSVSSYFLGQPGGRCIAPGLAQRNTRLVLSPVWVKQGHETGEHGRENRREHRQPPFHPGDRTAIGMDSTVPEAISSIKDASRDSNLSNPA